HTRWPRDWSSDVCSSDLTITDDGVWKLPEGDAFYAYLLRKNTTTRMKPEDLHDLGLREVARIEAEMRALLDANGFAGQSIGASRSEERRVWNEVVMWCGR